ncbi:MAG: SoxR reducing system RseC family protein [Spirochaetes bacterium]|nr:SoxR reducing system RseC family protein [Spirochaetota bacterium]
MRESGTVKDISGKIVVVGIPMHDSCQSCMNGMCKESRDALKVFNPEGIELSPGDEVEIEVKSAEQARAALWVLGLPLAALFAGYGLGRLFFPSAQEGPAVIAAGLFFVLFLGVGLLIQKRRNLESLPVITKKLEGLA